MTAKQAAKRLGVGPSMVVKWIDEGRIKSSKVGRNHWITPGALVAFESTRRKRGRPRINVLTAQQ